MHDVGVCVCVCAIQKEVVVKRKSGGCNSAWYVAGRRR